MPKYIISKSATRQLVAIGRYTKRKFGAYQAKAYLAGFQRTFDLLAHFPQMGRRVDELAPGLRRFRFQAHIVFYHEDADGVLIRTIQHHSRNITPELFE